MNTSKREIPNLGEADKSMYEAAKGIPLCKLHIQKAAETYKAALDVEPRDLRAAMSLAIAYFYQDQYESGNGVMMSFVQHFRVIFAMSDQQENEALSDDVFLLNKKEPLQHRIVMQTHLGKILYHGAKVMSHQDYENDTQVWVGNDVEGYQIDSALTKKVAKDAIFHVGRDGAAAYRYFKLSASQGNEDAKKYVARFQTMFKMQDEEKAKQKTQQRQKDPA